MKNLISFFVLVLISQTNFARTWVVDNNANSPVTLNNLQTAITDSANAGDTILVEGGGGSYGDISVTKPLSIFGEGYNDNLGETSVVNQVYLRASNVLFTGFSAAHITLDAANANGDSLNNVIVERNYSNTGLGFAGGPPPSNYYLMRNIKIRNNICQFYLFVSQNNSQDWILFDSLMVENNIFYQPAFFNWGGNTAGMSTVIFRNNLFFNGDNGQNFNTLFWYGYTGTNLHDAILYNNIFYDCNPTGSVNCTFMNNLTYGNGSTVNAPFGPGSNDTLPGPVNNNKYAQDPMFVTYSPNTAFSFNLDFHLQPGSPCIGAGVGGTDIGIYGGSYPFNVGEGPKTPIVDFVNISSSAVPQGSTFYLQFDARVRK